MKNIYFYFLYFFGLVSLFQPAYENFWIASGIGQHVTGRDNISFLGQTIQIININGFRLSKFLSIILDFIIIISILFSIFLYKSNKIKSLLLLLIISILYLIVNVFFFNEVLVYGYYLIIFQQIALLFTVYTFKKKIKFI